MINTSPTNTRRKIHIATFTGPASYSQSTLMDVDLTATFEQVDFLEMELTTQGANLPTGHFRDYALNTVGGGTIGASPGRCAVFIGLFQYTKITKLIDETNTARLTGLPGGVSAVNSLQNTAAGSSHTHDATHAHDSVNSQDENATANGVTAAVGGVNESNHDHGFSLNSLSVTSVGEATHVHSDAHIYDHNHTFTTSATNLTLTQLANGTNLSDCVWTLWATGQ